MGGTALDSQGWWEEEENDARSIGTGARSIRRCASGKQRGIENEHQSRRGQQVQGAATRTYPADRLGEDGADVHDLELSVGLLEVLGLRDRVGDLQQQRQRGGGSLY